VNFLGGILTDLRERRLLPVAVALAIALLAVPLLLHKSAADSDAVTSAAQPTGIPPTGPDQPLVALATLRTDSKLETFNSKNPFDSPQPIPELTSPELLDTSSSGGSPFSGGSSSGKDGGTGGDGGSGGGDTGGGDTGGGSALPPTSVVAPPTSPPTDDGDDSPDEGAGENGDDDEQTVTRTVFTHEVDLAFGSPGKLRTFRNIPRLSMLPSTEDPMLVFLGMDPSATKAVFLVDARLKQSGEGKCRDTACAFLELGVGNVHVFTDQDGTRYLTRLDQIRRVEVRAGASQTLRPSAGQGDESAEVGAGQETDDTSETARAEGQPEAAAAGQLVRRFISPLFGDLFVEKVQ